MKERCPSASFVCRAVLKDHQLVFSRYSKKWSGGVADVIPMLGRNVWGVVYEIVPSDLKRLDGCEGFREEDPHNASSYERKTVQVLQEGCDNNPREVFIYFANPQLGSPFDPSKKYMAKILWGARHWKLPEEYVKQLDGIRVKREEQDKS